MFLIYVQGESFVKFYGQGKKFLQNRVKLQVSRYDSQQPEGKSPWWFKFPWGAVTSQMGACAGLCVACSSPCLTSHHCAASIPGPPRATPCGPAFSKTGAYSKEQGHCLSLHWETSTPCNSSGLHHSLQKRCPFSLPRNPPLLLTESFYPSFPFTTGA